MITLLRNKISEYVTKFADISDWESVRTYYGTYSYLAFLCLAVNKIGNAKTLDEVIRIAIEKNIETEEIVLEASRIAQAEQFVSDILETTIANIKYDISNLYQEFLSVDFVVKNNEVVFDCGKNNRDVLGSYYTQYEFAEEITKKAIEDYFVNNTEAESIKIVDYSCGGAIFLLAAIDTCKKRNISARIYGYDVDPIAVLISRVTTDSHIDNCNNIVSKILLGNPLLPPKATCKEKFRKAVSGRYYNQDMGISPIKDADIILGNPPWEKIRFEEKKFFHHFLPDCNASSKTDRENIIKIADPQNAVYYMSLSDDYIHSKENIRKSSMFSESSCGELNTYALFTELCRRMVKPSGVASIIVKSSLVKMPVYSRFFESLTKSGDLYGLYMFSNKNKIFNIDSREEFSVIYMTKNRNSLLNVALNLTDYRDFTTKSTIPLSFQDLAILNPDTKMMPNIKSNNDLQFLIKLYKNISSFSTVYPDCRYGRLVHLTNHSNSIKKTISDGYSAIYEGKFIELYTGKYATFGQMNYEQKYKNKASARLIDNPQGNEYPESRYFIRNQTWENLSKNFHPGYVIAWRSLTSATNRRTMLATLLPLVPTCQSIQLLQLDDERQMLHILALFNSIVFDYIVRLKMVGLDLTQTIIKQIPVPNNVMFDRVIEYKGITATISNHIISRLNVLYADDKRVNRVFDKYQPYEIVADRKTIISDIDKIISLLYGINKQELKHIANSFDSYYSKDEVASSF